MKCQQFSEVSAVVTIMLAVGEIEGSLRLTLKLSGKWEAIKHFGEVERNVIAAMLGQEESGHSMFHGGVGRGD